MMEAVSTKVKFQQHICYNWPLYFHHQRRILLKENEALEKKPQNGSIR